MATNNKKQSKIQVARKAVSWAFATKYFNPVNWVKGSDTYEKGSIVSTSWQRMRSAWKLKRPEECRRETFEDAIARLGLSKNDIVMTENSLKKECFVLYAMSFAILCFSAFHALNGNLSGGLAGILFAFASATAAFLRAFRVWQIRNKRFGKLDEFARHVDAWLP